MAAAVANRGDSRLQATRKRACVHFMFVNQPIDDRLTSHGGRRNCHQAPRWAPDVSLMVIVDILGGARRYISGFGSMFKNAIPIGEEDEELDDGHRLPRTKYGSELDLTGAAIALDTEPQHPPGDYQRAGFFRCKEDSVQDRLPACQLVIVCKFVAITLVRSEHDDIHNHTRNVSQ